MYTLLIVLSSILLLFEVAFGQSVKFGLIAFAMTGIVFLIDFLNELAKRVD